MKLLLIDGNSLLFRAYYATAYAGVDKIMRNKEGYPTNALYGLANIVTKVINQEQPDYALVAFDTNKPTFRHQEYKEYKAGRAETPIELKQQFLPAREMLKLMGLFVYEVEGYEADDIVGTCSNMVDDSFDVRIYSADKDLLQLIKDNVSVCLTKKGVTDLQIMTPTTLKEIMGVTPTQITDLKGLMGDSSDNIPGVKGVGDKTAVKLLQEYNTLENIVDANIPGKLGEKIKEQKEIALMSKKIATINKEVPLPFTIDDLKYDGADVENLSSFLRKFDMYSLDKKLAGRKPKSIDFEFEEVTSIDPSFLSFDLAIYFESATNNYHFDSLIGIALSNSNKTYFIRKDNALKDLNLLSYLKDSKFQKFGFDIKKSIVLANKYGIEINNFSFDLMLGTYLIESMVKEDPQSIFNYFDILIDDKPKQNVEDYDNKIAKFSSMVAFNIFKLKDIVLEKLDNANQLKLFNDVEIKLAKILAKMEIKGIKVDKAFLQDRLKEINLKQEDISKKIFELAGYEFNINSPSQLGVVLFDKLGLPANKKRSTSAEELEFLAPMHPVIPYILEYRKLAKLSGTYYEGLQEYILEDSKIHTIYNQALTQTGRLSSRDPNLQNISVRSEEGKEVRKAFVASEGKLLLSFDYSQIELRVLADMANSNSLKDCFINDVDVHSKTASELFGVDIDSVNETQRRQAKTINFGIVYGMSSFELANRLGIGFGQANSFMNKYFETYPEIKGYFNKVIEDCEKSGFVKTKFNRTRRIVEINSSVHNEKERGKRIAMNTPIQGTAADIMKIQMIKLDEAIAKSNLDISMLLQIHDEVILEVKEEDLEKTIELVKKTMEDFDGLSVPLKVEYSYGKRWVE